MINIKIKRFDKTLPLPEQKTEGAVGFDLYARTDLVIKPNQTGVVPLNIALQVPDDYWVLLTARSSLHKKGLMLANGVGVGDSDYCGDNDEYRAVLLNFTNHNVEVKKGERLVQMIIRKKIEVKLEEVNKLNQKNRGGLGSTGE